jgi:hypothetical protein
MIGLSTTPVVATAVTAILGILALALPAYFQKTAPATLQAVDGGPPPLGKWLFPFGAALFLGTLFGLTLHVNNVLDFSSRDLREQYRSQGFTDDQIQRLMESHVKAATEKPTPPESVQPKNPFDNTKLVNPR